MLIDTHCHIHESDYPINPDDAIKRANQAGVLKLVCVGVNQQSSEKAIELSQKNHDVFAAVGVHPHDAKNGCDGIVKLIVGSDKPVIAIGEIGLDYYYDYSPRDVQRNILSSQIEIALNYKLPIIFHVRDAFDDFWPIFDRYYNKGVKIKGVLHCFTDNPINAQKAIDRGLFIGVGGFSTFVKNEIQKSVFCDIVPLEKIILETDSPYLTPVPFRGKINEPAFVRFIADNLADMRHVSSDYIADITTANARKLFKI